MSSIGVLGAGTWGTALAQVLTDNGHDVLLYARKKEASDAINLTHKNVKYFGDDITLSEKIVATSDLSLISPVVKSPIRN